MNPHENEMISFGAGINSVAMTILLVEQGWRGDIVFADTGNEHPDTYCYMEYFEREYLKPRGLDIVCLVPGDAYHDREAQEPLEDYCLRIGIIPLLAMRWCSIRWKRKPLKAFCQVHGIHADLLGISSDEPGRVRYDDESKRYPLVNANINRAECYRVIQRSGLQIPRKSACFFCPGHALGEWKNLFYEHPELYERACQMEEVATRKRRNGSTAAFRTDGTLRQLAARRWQGQIEMDLSHWLPCICAL